MIMEITPKCLKVLRSKVSQNPGSTVGPKGGRYKKVASTATPKKVKKVKKSKD